MSQELHKMLQELDHAFDTWFEIEDRIVRGHAYCAAHPNDPRGIALLQELIHKSAGHREAFEKANICYKELADRKEPQEASSRQVPAEPDSAAKSKAPRVVRRKSKAVPVVIMA